MQQSIADENVKQKSDRKEIDKIKKMIYMLRGSFQHIADVLRHVGDPNVSHYSCENSYVNSDLNLPLLDFAAFTLQQNPPELMDENGKY